MNLHSTIARRIFAPCLLALLSSSAYAQTHSEACQDIFSLSPVQADVHDGTQGQWWFTPAPVTPERVANAPLGGAIAPAPVLEGMALTPADAARFLGSVDDTVLIHWQSRVGDTMHWAQSQTYLIVRSGAPITDMQGNALGSFTRLIAKARWDTRVQVQPPAVQDAAVQWVAPLRIERAITEIDRNDRVIPRICLNKASSNSTPRVDIEPATQAQVLGLLEPRTMGARASFAVMDKGAAEGITMDQTWLVAQAISTETSGNITISRTRGQVEMLQVFEHFSLVRIDQTEREVMRGTYLKRAVQPSTLAPSPS